MYRPRVKIRLSGGGRIGRGDSAPGNPGRDGAGGGRLGFQVGGETVEEPRQGRADPGRDLAGTGMPPVHAAGVEALARAVRVQRPEQAGQVLSRSG